MDFQFTMVQARAASADGLSSRCGLVRESDGNSPFGKLARFPAVLRGGIVSATPISTHTYLESSVHLLWQKPTWPGAVTGRQPFPDKIDQNQRLAIYAGSVDFGPEWLF